MDTIQNRNHPSSRIPFIQHPPHATRALNSPRSGTKHATVENLPLLTYFTYTEQINECEPEQKGSVMDRLTEKQLTSENVFDGVLLDVYRDEVELPDGRTSVREYIKHPGAAVMIPVLDNGDILFERQYRYPLGKALYELPAGKIDPGEDALQSARRELLEETGYEGASFTKLGELNPCIGYSDEVIHIYLVEGLAFHGQQQDQDEFIHTFKLSLRDALEYIRTGKITDAKTMVSVFWIEKYMTGEWSPAETRKPEVQDEK